MGGERQGVTGGKAATRNGVEREIYRGRNGRYKYERKEEWKLESRTEVREGKKKQDKK